MIGLETLEDRCVPSGVIIDGGGNLVVTGTAGNDTVTVNHTNPAAVTVQINGTYQGTFDLLSTEGRVIVWTLAGMDVVLTPGFIPVEVHGGDGNDYVYGGDSFNILYGEGGNDYLSGSPHGHDVLVGGLGRDTLSGGGGDDVLIGGDVSWDFASLVAVGTDWSTNHDPYSPLISSLVTSINDPDSTTNVDILVGGSGADLYMYRDTGVNKDIPSGFLIGVDDKRTY